jgi:catechol 2,3-dioxygenase-like lactoylglutathione lyase family enzyme
VQTEERFRECKYHRCHSGLNHLAFHGLTKEFVDKLTGKLKSKNITILYEDRHPYAGGAGYYAVYFEDPNRMKVEVVAE